MAGAAEQLDLEFPEEEETEIENNPLDLPDDEVDALLMAAPAVVPEPVKAEEQPAEVEESDELPPQEKAPVEAPKAPVEAPEVKAKPVEEDASAVDYKAAYDQLMAPFKANNREMKVDSVEEALTLMKMGANYNKKMAALKPNLKLLKMLENHDLLDESKLSYLIDLDKKNPGAVQKLMKDSGIDPLEVDLDKTTDYRPTTYTVNDNEMELDNVLEEIKYSKGYATTTDVISNKWDMPSKQVLLSNPSIIKIINDHVETGIYAQITAVVEKERMLGRLTGLSDIEAYKQVGDYLQAQNAFQPKQAQPAVAMKPSPIATTKPVKGPSEEELRNRKKAAGSTKASPSKQVSMDFNPLALSDEEFEKISSKFI